MILTSDITGLILADGRGSRMGGVDKGLQTFCGAPTMMHTLMHLSLQVGPMLINASRNLAAYKSFDMPVMTDSTSDFVDPLAGILVGLEQCETYYLLTAPCDSPLVLADLAVKLSHVTDEARARIAMSAMMEPDEQGRPCRQVQSVLCLIGALLADDLIVHLQDGGRKIESWTARHPTADVLFDDNSASASINTLEELHQPAERRQDASATDPSSTS